MSFAVIQTGGKQYKVKASDILKIERLKNSKPESKIEFNEVLAYGDDNTLEVGSPLVKGAKVEAELMENSKNRTILIISHRTNIFKYCKKIYNIKDGQAEILYDYKDLI